MDEGGLILSGGKGIRPFFAYGKVVKLKKREDTSGVVSKMQARGKYRRNENEGRELF